MRKLLFLFPFFLLGNFSFAQINLVPNPSFEDTVNCPDGIGGIEIATGWFNSGGSPDYFNSCANTGYLAYGVPYNYVGHQVAYDGNGYAGIVAWASFSQREFIGIELLQPLVSGNKYFASTYISRADSADLSPYTCSCNNFGFRFSTFPYEYAQLNPAPVDNFSHLHSTSIISDTLNWTRISGSFIADSTYQYLTIGNFYDNSNTDTLACYYSSLGLAYYFLDAICVSTDSLTCLNWTGIIGQNIQSNEIYAYPNPVNSILHLGNIANEITYSLTNITGQIICQGKFCNQINQLDVSFLANGIYFLNTETKKLKILIIH